MYENDEKCAVEGARVLCMLHAAAHVQYKREIFMQKKPKDTNSTNKRVFIYYVVVYPDFMIWWFLQSW